MTTLLSCQQHKLYNWISVYDDINSSTCVKTYAMLIQKDRGNRNLKQNA